MSSNRRSPFESGAVIGMRTWMSPGAISGAPGMVFVSSGGEFDLIGQNTYAGSTFIAAGKLHISNPIGTVIAGSGITIANGVNFVLGRPTNVGP